MGYTTIVLPADDPQKNFHRQFVYSRETEWRLRVSWDEFGIMSHSSFVQVSRFAAVFPDPKPAH
jgi:hypothetical protein